MRMSFGDEDEVERGEVTERHHDLAARDHVGDRLGLQRMHDEQERGEERGVVLPTGGGTGQAKRAADDVEQQQRRTRDGGPG